MTMFKGENSNVTAMVIKDGCYHKGTVMRCSNATEAYFELLPRS